LDQRTVGFHAVVGKGEVGARAALTNRTPTRARITAFVKALSLRFRCGRCGSPHQGTGQRLIMRCTPTSPLLMSTARKRSRTVARDPEA
jgi:hypothetical protein